MKENKELSLRYDIENVVYDHFLLDVPKLFELIIIYPNQKKIIKSMVE